jgi:hypothetical protein
MFADGGLRYKQHLRRLTETKVGGNFHKNTMGKGDHTAKLPISSFKKRA